MAAKSSPNAILIIEGADGHRNQLTSYLKDHLDQLHVWSASTSRQALRLLEDCPVDAVVIHDDLPDSAASEFLMDAGGLLRGVPRLVIGDTNAPCDATTHQVAQSEPPEVLAALGRLLPGILPP